MSQALGMELYPEIAATGSLAAALNAELSGRNVDDVFLGVAERPLVASIVRQEAKVGVILGSARRVFILTFSRSEIFLAQGSTPSISDAVQVALEWLSGVNLRTLGSSWGFIQHTDLQEAYESGDGPAAVWNVVHREAVEPLRGFIELARQDPRVSQLYPVVGHNILRFKEELRANIFVLPSIAVVSDDAFRISYPGEGLAPVDRDAAATLARLTSWLESRE